MRFSICRKNSFHALAILVSPFIMTCMISSTPCFAYDSSSGTPKTAQDEAAKKMVAKVNDVPIYESALKKELSKTLEKYKKYGFSESNKEAVANLRNQALDSLIDQTIMAQAYNSLKVEDMDKRLGVEIDALKKAAGSDEQFEPLVKGRFGSKENMEETLRNKIQMAVYLEQKGITDPKVSDEELREMYEKSKEGLKRPEGLKTKHILFGVPADAEEKAWKEAEEKASAARKNIIAGSQSFETAVTDFSACGDSKDKGGDLGFIQRGFMPKEFDEVAFSLPFGELSAPVKTKYGYHLIQTEQLRPAGITPFDEAKAFLEKYLKSEKAAKAIQAHVKMLRDEAKVEILPE